MFNQLKESEKQHVLVNQSNTHGFRELALFAGAGGGILGGKLLGWQTVCAVEREPYATAVLLARQNDHTFETPFPIWDDVCSFDGKPWRGRVDVVSGGFPCQDISTAGKGVGLGGERSGLWSEMARIIGEVQPKYVFIENSPMLVKRGLGKVLFDLAQMGYAAEWGCLSAGQCGAPHKRERIWIVGVWTGCPVVYPNKDASSKANSEIIIETRKIAGKHQQSRCASRVLRGTNTDQRGFTSLGLHDDQSIIDGHLRDHGEIHFQDWPHEPAMGRMVDGVAHRTHRVNALGNGQVPRVAAAAFSLLHARLMNRLG